MSASKLKLPFDPRVADLIEQGKHDKEIAAELGMSYNTVRWHVQQAMKRLNANTRAHLVFIHRQSL